MLTASKLEKIIELEDNLKSQYQAQLDAIEAQLQAKQAELDKAARSRDELQATVAKQLETISDLSEKATANQRVEQLNRELSNRSEKLQEEFADLKKRAKSLQRELITERDELKALKQLDPVRMKKNLAANKKKLAEKAQENDALQKALGKTRAEKAELEQKVRELEARLEELAPAEVASEESEAESAAA